MWIMALELVSTAKCFKGEQRVYLHYSHVLGCEMKFGVFMPPAAIESNTECPVLYFLSGFTCTPDNFIKNSGMQQHAAKHNLVVVNPDTSPRNINLPGENETYDFGSGAGFYLDATKTPWSENYKMYSYVIQELIALVNQYFPVLRDNKGICGHGMGGHGALIFALKNPGEFRSVSALAPICNPIECPWGKKAFAGYLSENKSSWEQWDATELIKIYNGPLLEIFIDQGLGDGFLKQRQLLPNNLVSKAFTNDHIRILYKQREGYDHSYFYVATFIGEHIEYHANLLKA